MKKMTLDDHALEMIMRDVLDGMADFSLHAAYSANNFGMEILAVEPADRTCAERATVDDKPLADVIFPPQFWKAAG